MRKFLTRMPQCPELRQASDPLPKYSKKEYASRLKRARSLRRLLLSYSHTRQERKAQISSSYILYDTRRQAQALLRADRRVDGSFRQTMKSKIIKIPTAHG